MNAAEAALQQQQQQQPYAPSVYATGSALRCWWSSEIEVLHSENGEGVGRYELVDGSSGMRKCR